MVNKQNWQCAVAIGKPYRSAGNEYAAYYVLRGQVCGTKRTEYVANGHMTNQTFDLPVCIKPLKTEYAYRLSGICKDGFLQKINSPLEPKGFYGEFSVSSFRSEPVKDGCRSLY